jgi:hypothetical protein
MAIRPFHAKRSFEYNVGKANVGGLNQSLILRGIFVSVGTKLQGFLMRLGDLMQ